MKSTLKNMVLTLFVITLAAAAGVGAVYYFTAEPIRTAMDGKKEATLKMVLPDFDNDPSTDMQQADGLIIYKATMDGQPVGYAVETSAGGFGGPVKLMAGFRPDGGIIRIEVLEHAETPGLGDKIERSKSDFSVQFEGKDPKEFKLMVRKDGGDVDAITASTITSRAYVEAVARAYEAVMDLGGSGTDAAGGVTATEGAQDCENPNTGGDE